LPLLGYGIQGGWIVMDGFYLALGVTIVLPFFQWAVPTMPRIVAYSGVIGGILVMLLEFLDPLDEAALQFSDSLVGRSHLYRWGSPFLLPAD
jgi:hypothetical protein